MRIDVITTFPAYFDALEEALVGKARAAGVLNIPCTICAITRPTNIAPSTTSSSAADPGWS